MKSQGVSSSAPLRRLVVVVVLLAFLLLELAVVAFPSRVHETASRLLLGGTTCSAESCISQKAETAATTTGKMFKIGRYLGNDIGDDKEEEEAAAAEVVDDDDDERRRRKKRGGADRLATRAMRGCKYICKYSCHGW